MAVALRYIYPGARYRRVAPLPASHMEDNNWTHDRDRDRGMRMDMGPGPDYLLPSGRSLEDTCTTKTNGFDDSTYSSSSFPTSPRGPTANPHPHLWGTHALASSSRGGGGGARYRGPGGTPHGAVLRCGYDPEVGSPSHVSSPYSNAAPHGGSMDMSLIEEVERIKCSSTELRRMAGAKLKASERRRELLPISSDYDTEPVVPASVANKKEDPRSRTVDTKNKHNDDDDGAPLYTSTYEGREYDEVPTLSSPNLRKHAAQDAAVQKEEVMMGSKEKEKEKENESVCVVSGQDEQQEREKDVPPLPCEIPTLNRESLEPPVPDYGNGCIIVLGENEESKISLLASLNALLDEHSYFPPTKELVSRMFRTALGRERPDGYLDCAIVSPPWDLCEKAAAVASSAGMQGVTTLSPEKCATAAGKAKSNSSNDEKLNLNAEETTKASINETEEKGKEDKWKITHALNDEMFATEVHGHTYVVTPTVGPFTFLEKYGPRGMERINLGVVWGDDELLISAVKKPTKPSVGEKSECSPLGPSGGFHTPMNAPPSCTNIKSNPLCPSSNSLSPFMEEKAQGHLKLSLLAPETDLSPEHSTASRGGGNYVNSTRSASCRGVNPGDVTLSVFPTPAPHEEDEDEHGEVMNDDDRDREDPAVVVVASKLSPEREAQAQAASLKAQAMRKLPAWLLTGLHNRTAKALLLIINASSSVPLWYRAPMRKGGSCSNSPPTRTCVGAQQGRKMDTSFVARTPVRFETAEYAEFVAHMQYLGYKVVVTVTQLEAVYEWVKRRMYGGWKETPEWLDQCAANCFESFVTKYLDLLAVVLNVSANRRNVPLLEPLAPNRTVFDAVAFTSREQFRLCQGDRSHFVPNFIYAQNRARTITRALSTPLTKNLELLTGS